MGRREFRFATAAMREGRMLRAFTRIVASCVFALAGLIAVIQFTPSGPHGPLNRLVHLTVLVSALIVGMLWARRPWPGYRAAVAFVVWVDVALASAAITMSTPEARLCVTLYLGLVGVYVGFLLGGRILLAHCAFSSLVIAGTVGWAVIGEHRNALGLFDIAAPALVWSVALPLGGLVLIDIGRNSIRRTVRSAQHDPVTGLRNRRGLRVAVDTAIRQMSPTALVIAVCDIDRFKAFNDGHGHATGDAALLSLAGTMRALAGDNDVAARIGGDEFVLVSFVHERDDTLLSRLESLTRGDVDGVALTASVGVAWCPCEDPHFSIDDGIRHADEAMYEAKRAGGARCAIYGSPVGRG